MAHAGYPSQLANEVMSVSLAPTQKKAIRWLVEKTEEGALEEDSVLYSFSADGGAAVQSEKDNVRLPDYFSKSTFEILDKKNLVHLRRGSNGGCHVSLTGEAYEFTRDSRGPARQESISNNREVAEESSQEDEIRVFISHTFADKEIAEALADLLAAALDLSSKDIRCTSVPGYKPEPGADTADVLRLEVNRSTVLIGIITLESLNSSYVLFELGARWGAGRNLVPLLARNASYSSLPKPIRGTNALEGTERTDVLDLLDFLSESLETELAKSSVFDKHVNRLTEASKKKV